MRTRKKGVLFFCLVLTSLLSFAQTPTKIRIIVDYADIRSNPALDAPVLNVAVKGEIYVVADKTQAWYKIKLSVDPSGQVAYGYVHESMVTPIEMAEGQKEVVEAPKEPAPPAKPAEPTQIQPAQKPTKALAKNVFSGSSLKFGYGKDRWIASVGSDFGIKRNFALGIELQPYYKDYSDKNLTVLEMNVFANAKLGFRFSFLSLYGGGGIGPNLSYSNSEIEGESVTQFKTKLAYHVMAGTALNIGSIAFLFEFQMIQVSHPEIGLAKWMYFLLFGLRF